MPKDLTEPFSDNWTYLRAELLWLDRVLSLAIARQRKDTQVVERLAKTRADRVTSHWWKGLVSLEGEISSDSPADHPRRQTSSAKGNFQQQMTAKIQASQEQGIWLSLPRLQARLQLSEFEKNLVVMALAPEVSRRYGKIYDYLQEVEQIGSQGLPTVDLVLRLLCRNDSEWRSARQRLADRSVLHRYHLLELQPSSVEAFLAHPVKLAPPLVNYLLADQPDQEQLEALLQPVPAQAAPLAQLTYWSSSREADPWPQIVLPLPLLAKLQHLCDRVRLTTQIEALWNPSNDLGESRGSLVLLSGASGSGKTTVARAIAQVLQRPLAQVDLRLHPPDQQAHLLQEIGRQAPPLLLLEAAEVLLGRTRVSDASELHRFFQQRRSTAGITLLTTHHIAAIAPSWRQLMTCLELPLPDEAGRLRLWQQAFPATIAVADDLDWQRLARRFRLSGGKIRELAREATIYALADRSPVTLAHILQARQLLAK